MIFFMQRDFANENSWDFNVSGDASKVIFISNSGSIDPIDLAVNVKLIDLKINHMVNFVTPYLISTSIAKITQQKKIPFYIFNISSGASIQAVSGWSAYCSSKAAIRISLDCIAKENSLVSVAHFDPGVMDTEMQRKIRSSSQKKMYNQQTFIDYFAHGKLKHPKNVAVKVLSSIESFINENCHNL